MQSQEVSVFRSLADLPRAGVAEYGTIILRMGEDSPATILVDGKEVGRVMGTLPGVETGREIRVKSSVAGGDVIQIVCASRRGLCVLGGVQYRMASQKNPHTVVARFVELSKKGEFADVRVPRAVFDIPEAPELLMGGVVYLRMLEKGNKIKVVGRQGEYPKYVLC
jgi:hypothetical protein